MIQSVQKNSILEARVQGSFSTRYWLEFLGNSVQLPLANILLELIIEGPLYLLSFEFFVMIFASAVQSYWLTRWQTTSNPHRLSGNLIAPGIYTLVGLRSEGLTFFAAPNHTAYWFFAITIGVLQALCLRSVQKVAALLIVFENVVRTLIIFWMYALLETFDDPGFILSWQFLQDKTHIFILLSLLLFSFSIGLANLTSERYLNLLKATLSQLKTYSEWLLGRDLLNYSIDDPSVLNLTKKERTVLFMDIRNFTRWSETVSPEKITYLLNQYYQISENVLQENQVIKFKLSADEVMAVFASVNTGIVAAIALRSQINGLLSRYQLSVGIGINRGLLMEGLIGTQDVKFYDVIGDTVNTAKRIESAAGAGEILISESVQCELDPEFTLKAQRQIQAKGKKELLNVYVMGDDSFY